MRFQTKNILGILLGIIILVSFFFFFSEGKHDDFVSLNCLEAFRGMFVYFDSHLYFGYEKDISYDDFWQGILGIAGHEANWNGKEFHPTTSHVSRYFRRSFAHFTTVLNGHEVECEIQLNNKTALNDSVFLLRKGENYHLSAVYYSTDNQLYEANEDFSADKVKICKTIELKPVAIENVYHFSGSNSLDMVQIHKGNFLMGSPKTESGRLPTELQHHVILSEDFWISDTPITQAQYQCIIGNNPVKERKQQNEAQENIEGSDIHTAIGKNFPVTYVSWYNALEFCRKLNLLTEGKRPMGYYFNLPTEAEWEYSCRAGTKTAYSYGDKPTKCKMNTCIFSDDEKRFVQPDGGVPYAQLRFTMNMTQVKNFSANPWGIFDMHGNVFEWCYDSADMIKKEHDLHIITSTYQDEIYNPICVKGRCRIIRGGCYACGGLMARSASRDMLLPIAVDPLVGFRVVLCKRKLEDDVFNAE